MSGVFHCRITPRHTQAFEATAQQLGAGSPAAQAAAAQWNQGKPAVSFMQLNSNGLAAREQNPCCDGLDMDGAVSKKPAEDKTKTKCDTDDGREDEALCDNPVHQGLRELGLVEDTPSFGFMFSDESGGPLFSTLQLVRAFSNAFTVTCGQLLKILRQLPPIRVAHTSCYVTEAHLNSDTIVGRGNGGDVSAVASSDDFGTKSGVLANQTMSQADAADANGDMPPGAVVCETPAWVTSLGPEAVKQWQVCVLIQYLYFFKALLQSFHCVWYILYDALVPSSPTNASAIPVGQRSALLRLLSTNACQRCTTCVCTQKPSTRRHSLKRSRSGTACT